MNVNLILLKKFLDTGYAFNQDEPLEKFEIENYEN